MSFPSCFTGQNNLFAQLHEFEIFLAWTGNISLVVHQLHRALVKFHWTCFLLRVLVITCIFLSSWWYDLSILLGWGGRICSILPPSLPSIGVLSLCTFSIMICNAVLFNLLAIVSHVPAFLFLSPYQVTLQGVTCFLGCFFDTARPPRHYTVRQFLRSVIAWQNHIVYCTPQFSSGF